MKYDVTKAGYILLGRCGENHARTIELDVSDYLSEYPDATVTLLHRRHGETEIYPVAAELQDGCLVWCPSSADVGVAGDGSAEIRVTIGDTVAKSRVLCTVVEKSLTGQVVDAPEPSEDWVQKVLTAINDAMEAKVTAENIQAALGYAPAKVPESQSWGIVNNNSKEIAINPASNTVIMSRSTRQPITPGNLDAAVRIALCDDVGAEWTASEQLSARRRMGLPGQYEQIEEMTLRKETSFINRSVSLKDLFLRVETPNTSDADGYLYVVLYFDGEGTYRSFYCGKCVAKGAKAVGTLHAVNHCGMFFVDTTTPISVASSATSFLVQPNGQGIIADKITGIKFTNCTFPVNTKIEIYGVRA